MFGIAVSQVVALSCHKAKRIPTEHSAKLVKEGGEGFGRPFRELEGFDGLSSFWPLRYAIGEKRTELGPAI